MRPLKCETIFLSTQVGRSVIEYYEYTVLHDDRGLSGLELHRFGNASWGHLYTELCFSPVAITLKPLTGLVLGIPLAARSTINFEDGVCVAEFVCHW